jgi:hypothetical protein
MTRALRVGLALVLSAWGCRAPAEGPHRASRAAEPVREAEVVAQVGGREVSVRCVLDCEGLTRELGRLRARCIEDPMSTPHQVHAQEGLVAFGCCSAARHAYDEACGLEAQAPCASRWTAGCESGRLVR